MQCQITLKKKTILKNLLITKSNKVQRTNSPTNNLKSLTNLSKMDKMKTRKVKSKPMTNSLKTKMLLIMTKKVISKVVQKTIVRDKSKDLREVQKEYGSSNLTLDGGATKNLPPKSTCRKIILISQLKNSRSKITLISKPTIQSGL